MNKGPDFIGIGMERAGTSWLFTQLAAHPDIWVPPLKELHFFDVIDPKARYLTHRYSYHLKSRIKQKLAPLLDTSNRPEFSKNNYLTYLLWDYYFFTGKFNVEWYKRLFSQKFTKGKVSGEITPAYSNLTSKTIKKILDMNADTKFLMMVRNPLQRMWSGLVHHFRHVEKKDFSKVTEENMFEFLQNSAAKNRSDLFSILETWQENVPENQLLIQPFEDISNTPEALIQNTYSFLGVNHNFLPPGSLYQRKINAYTQEEINIPENIKNYMIEQCQDGIQALQTSHPEIVKNWKEL